MNTNEGSIKTGHPVAGVVLAILGILVALVLTLLFGVYAGAVSALLGIGAVLLGIRARKGGRGIGAIVTGILSLILAVAMTFTSVSTMKTFQKVAKESNVAPVFAESFDNPYTGICPTVFKLAGEPEKLNALTKELDALKNCTAAAETNAAAEVSAAHTGC